MPPEVQLASRPHQQDAARVECDLCGRRFSRPSHLNRHRLSHLPADRRLTIPCDKCRKTFGRYDVLLRHLRSTHNIDLGRRHPAQRSCDRCVQKRRRCDRRMPCELCQSTGDVCHYPNHMTGTYADKTAPLGAVAQAEAEAVAAAATKTESASGSSSRNANENYYGNTNVNKRSRSSSSSNNNSEKSASHGSSTSTASSTQSSTSVKESPATSSTETPQESQFNDYTATTLDPIMSAPLVGTLPSNYNDPSLLNTTYAGDLGTSFSQNESSMMPGDSFVPPILLTGNQLDYRSAQLGCLDFQMPNFNQSSGLAPTSNSINMLMDTPMHMEPLPSIAPPQSIDMTPPSSMPPALFPIPPKSVCPPKLPKIASQDPMQDTNRPPKLSWPVNRCQHSRGGFMLPPLRDLLKKTLPSRIPRLNDSARALQTGLVMLMGDTYIPKAENITDPNTTRARQLVANLLDMYFEHFYAILPIVHKPTFSMSTSPTVLVAVMACLGALMQDSKQGTDDADTMSEISTSIITYLASSNSDVYSDITYITALCLQLIYTIWSGNRQLYQYADRSRGLLVGSLRGLNSLSTRLGTDKTGVYEPSNGVADNSNNVRGMRPDHAPRNHWYNVTAAAASPLYDEWKQWAEHEQVKRVAWAAFEYDCSLCTLTNRPGVVGLNELPTRFPCNETLWMAESAEAWAELRSRMTIDDLMGVPFSEMLGSLMADPGGGAAALPVPQKATFWSRQICAELLVQLMWNLRQLEILGTVEFFGMPSLASAQDANKTKLLKGLDKLMDSMPTPRLTADMVHYNISGIAWHFSYIYNSGSLLDDVMYIVRTTVARNVCASNPDDSVLQAQRRIQNYSIANLPSRRRLFWHCAQIFAIANDCLTTGPCDIMRVFITECFLLVCCQYCPFRDLPPPPLVPELMATTDPAIRLDVPVHRESKRFRNDYYRIIERWIETGQPPEIIGSADKEHIDVAIQNMCDDAKRLLRRLNCFGMASHFIDILESFERLQLKENPGVASAPI